MVVIPFLPYTDPGSGSEWETPVGIAVVTHIKHQSVIAVIQAAPPELNITSYQLTLVDTHNGFNDDEKILSEVSLGIMMRQSRWTWILFTRLTKITDKSSKCIYTGN